MDNEHLEHLADAFAEDADGEDVDAEELPDPSVYYNPDPTDRYAEWNDDA